MMPKQRGSKVHQIETHLPHPKEQWNVRRDEIGHGRECQFETGRHMPEHWIIVHPVLMQREEEEPKWFEKAFAEEEHPQVAKEQEGGSWT